MTDAVLLVSILIVLIWLTPERRGCVYHNPPPDNLRDLRPKRPPPAPPKARRA